jgi:hypothetical protein
VSRVALPGYDASRVPLSRPAARSGGDRLLRTPLTFETLEPRVLLSGDIIPSTGQTAILAGLQSFAAWTQNNLTQSAQLAQQLPVVSSSLGDLVDVHDQITNDLVTPAKNYFDAATTNATVEGLAAALNAANASETVSALGQFADGEYLVALTAFQTTTPITAALPSPATRCRRCPRSG